jgi:hypothetical protein
MSAAFDLSKNRVGRAVQMCKQEGLIQAPLEPRTDSAAAPLKLDVDGDANEAWLLHGCRPEYVLPILQNGLDEKLCQLEGAFGAGIYLAEDVEKIDQYTTPDSSYEFSGLEELHSRLYRPGGHHHPEEDLFYCFVVRTISGWPIRTEDGMGDLDDPSTEWVYANELKDKRTLTHVSRMHCPNYPKPCGICERDKLSRRELKEVSGVSPPVRYHMLVVEKGKALLRFREFVCFDRAQTYCQYLLAYKRA